MSSWKNASKASQRTHKERHQPQSREHLGLLEKKKDYKQRAKDFQDKQATLKLLRKRALSRNPDEFYFHMINSRVKEGVHHEVPKEMEDEDTVQQLQLMSSQDLRYVTMKRTTETKKLGRLQSELHLLDLADQTPNKHLFFVSSKKEAKNFDVVKHLKTHPSLLQRRSNRLRIDDLKTMNLPKVSKKELRNMSEEKTKRYNELSKRVEREHELAVVEQKLHTQKELVKANQNKPVQISAGTKNAPPIYRWKYERKR